MVAFVIAVVSYVLGSLGYYTIAKRRGIHHAWLAWVPVVNVWLHGCISDHYQSFAKGKVKNKRTVMLVLNIILCVVLVVAMVMLVLLVAQMPSVEDPYMNEDLYPGIYEDDIYDTYYDDDIPEELMGTVWCMIAAYIMLIFVSIPLAVLRYMALYDLFVSCDPGSGVVFLLLSIFLGIEAFLVFACREKDQGLPSSAPPVYPAYQMPYGQPPVYTAPPQNTEVDPWERKEE